MGVNRELGHVWTLVWDLILPFFRCGKKGGKKQCTLGFVIFNYSLFRRPKPQNRPLWDSWLPNPSGLELVWSWLMCTSENSFSPPYDRSCYFYVNFVNVYDSGTAIFSIWYNIFVVAQSTLSQDAITSQLAPPFPVCATLVTFRRIRYVGNLRKWLAILGFKQDGSCLMGEGYVWTVLLPTAAVAASLHDSANQAVHRTKNAIIQLLSHTPW